MPLRVGSRHRAGTVRFTATLTDPDGVQRELDAAERPVAQFADGGVLAVDLPPALASGEYRLHITVAIGRASAAREIAFRVLP